jgi:GTP-dependent dephospho-CoA kinase
VVFKKVVGDLIPSSGLPALLDSLRNTPFPIVTVGDTTTLNFVRGNVVPDLSIIDLGTRRGDLPNSEKEILEEFMSGADVLCLKNPQEWITVELWEAIRNFFQGYSSHPGREQESVQADGYGPMAGGHYKKFKIGRPDRMATTPKIIWIEGEEDLASLPCIHFTSTGGHVFYGLPDKGLIHIQVQQDHRTIVRDALKMMEAYDEPLNNKSDRQSTT